MSKYFAGAYGLFIEYGLPILLLAVIVLLPVYLICTSPTLCHLKNCSRKMTYSCNTCLAPLCTKHTFELRSNHKVYCELCFKKQLLGVNPK